MEKDSKEGLGFISSDNLQTFNKNLREAKALPRMQEELVDKVLKGEQAIIETRNAGLMEYFDRYSRELDRLADKQSKLYNSFNDLNKKFAENSKFTNGATDSTAEVGKTKQSKQAASRDTQQPAQTSEINTGEKELVGVIRELVTTIRYHSKAGSEYAAGIEGGGGLGGTRGAGSNGSSGSGAISSSGVDVYDTASNGVMASLPPIDLITEQDLIQEREKRIHASENRIHQLQVELALAKQQTEEELLARSTEIRLSQVQKTLQAEIDAQKFLNEQKDKTKLDTSRKGSKLLVDELMASERTASMQSIEKKKREWIEQEIFKIRLANDGKITAKQMQDLQKSAKQQFKLTSENIANETKLRLEEEAKNNKRKEIETRRSEKEEAARRKEASRSQIAHAVDFNSLSREDNLLKRFKDLDETLKDNFEGENLAKAQMAAAITALSSLAQQLEKTVDEIALHKGVIDTRLQGSKNDTYMGSYWDQLVKDMTSVGAVNPYFKQESFAKNIEALVNRGIAFDLKQRAFLMTIQEKIANTFDAADGTLLRLIRIQQEDSTAGRLGMESALNSFLNEMYENTEYLQGVAKSVRDHLQEMESLMTGAAATEVEYQVQKWMGSLYSVGMSDAAVNTISTALGQIAAGQIEGLTGGGAGNLLVMAANNAGIPIADILATGLTAEDTNKLLQATVNYLAQMAESSKDNNVVQQQLANVFGVKASDLRAATNLATPDTLSSISGSNLTYQNLLAQLFNMAGSMGRRTSVGEMMSNVWANGQYTLAGSMASNPLAYLTYKAATLLDNVAGGIAIPAFSVMGNMVDLETTIADLMRVGAMSGGILGSLGEIISGLGNSFDGRLMLNKLGITAEGSLAINQRGTGAVPALVGGGQQTLSTSGYAGNASGSDIKDSTMQSAEDDKKKQMIKAQEEAGATQIDMINTSVLKIYEILDEVTRGSKTLRVSVDNYGLTGENARVSQGGTTSLLSSGESANSLGATPSNSKNKSVSSSGTVSGSVLDLGGWTIM